MFNRTKSCIDINYGNYSTLIKVMEYIIQVFLFIVIMSIVRSNRLYCTHYELVVMES